MANWYRHYAPSWIQRWWQPAPPPRPLNPFRNTRPDPDISSNYLNRVYSLHMIIVRKQFVAQLLFNRSAV